jgi:ribonucleoside-diphosphate reductase alpha chain
MSTALLTPPSPFSGAIAEIVREVPQITTDLWSEKYRHRRPDGTPLEDSIRDSNARIVRGVYIHDPTAPTEAELALWAMNNLLWNPGGRIQAGAGTDKLVTLINCYVNDDLADSMHDELGHAGIMTGLRYAALTQQQGGGIGTPFQSLRPSGALVRRTGSVSSGVIPFMRMWHSMCSTIMSSGSRRGAMMATISDNHADLYRPEYHTETGRKLFQERLTGYLNGTGKLEAIPVDFINAKHIPNELTNFNVSVLISDRFMSTLNRQELWDLGFTVEPADKSKLIDKYPVGEGSWFYVYNRVPAQQIWDNILRSTYEYAEPGVLFIDRINEMNNLWYCERINCTNPCGEQPLPAHGACNLGAVNYAMLVKDPFTSHAKFDFDLLKEVAAIGQRFLDNVLDVTNYPLPQQKEESVNKRRTGNGLLGLGTALQMLGIRYGSPLAVEFTREMLKAQRDAVYQASIDLAKERGPFPLFDRDKYLAGKFIKTLPESLREQIAEHGIRNGVAMTIAPTGNTGILHHCVTGSGEPEFVFEYDRDVLQADGTKKEYRVESFGWRVFKKVMKIDPQTAQRTCNCLTSWSPPKT